MQIFSLCFLFFLAHCVVSPGVLGFSATPPTLTSRPTAAAWTRYASSEGDAGQHQDDAVNDMIARRIIVTGDVQGGYYRSCVLNEVGTKKKHHAGILFLVVSLYMRVRPVALTIFSISLHSSCFSCLLTGGTVSKACGNHDTTR
jgi:hypothetical protein